MSRKIETFQIRNLDVMAIPSVLMNSHEPFSLGTDPLNAVNNAVVLEEYIFMAI